MGLSVEYDDDELLRNHIDEDSIMDHVTEKKLLTTEFLKKYAEENEVEISAGVYAFDEDSELICLEDHFSGNDVQFLIEHCSKMSDELRSNDNLIGAMALDALCKVLRL